MIYKRMVFLIVWLALIGIFTLGCQRADRSMLPTLTPSLEGVQVSWFGPNTLRFDIELPENLRIGGTFVEILLGLSPELRPVLLRTDIPVQAGQSRVSLALSTQTIPVDRPFYWQAYWIDPRGNQQQVPILVRPVETRIVGNGEIPELIVPGEEDEIPRDLLFFLWRPGPNFQNVNTTYRVQVSRTADFKNILRDWAVATQGSEIRLERPNALNTGHFFWRTYAIQEGDTTIAITGFRHQRFQVITGCDAWNQSRYAVRAVKAHLNCTEINAYTDPTRALGPPDAHQLGQDTFTGIVSLGVDGWIELEVGQCVHDGPGADIRVYQTVSFEGVEVQVAPNKNGPWVSLGTKLCGEPSNVFSHICEFDMADGGVTVARFVRVIDHICVSHPFLCGCNLQSVQTPGADIDAVEVLH